MPRDTSFDGALVSVDRSRWGETMNGEDGTADALDAVSIRVVAPVDSDQRIAYLATLEARGRRKGNARLSGQVRGLVVEAIRHLAANWNFALIRRILFVSMTVAIASSLVGIPAYGAFGAAISVFIGALLLNGQAVQAAFAGCSART